MLKHPLLVIDLGFHLVLDPTAPYGFDCGKTLPCKVRLRKKLRFFDPTLLQALLTKNVRDLLQEIPGLGETVAFDVKHIYAWVRENNPRESIIDRFSKDRQPQGDLDCKVGVKRSTNQQQPDGSKKIHKEYLWGRPTQDILYTYR